MAVSKRLRFEILRRDNHTCRYCGRSAPEVKLTIDHVIPETLGGSDDPSNLVAACADCNGGKSSVPADAAVVVNISQDALRWSQAMQQAADERALDRNQAAQLHAAFTNEWDSWTDRRGNTCERPPAWTSSIDQFLAAGLSMDDLTELVTVAMTSRSTDTWRYFCGCCWRRIRDLQDRAAEIVEQGEQHPLAPTLDISTRWTQRDLDRLLTLDGVGVQYSGPLFECEDHIDGQCENDTLCQIVSAARTRESLEMFSIQKHQREREAEAINAAADEAEDYVYG